MESTQLVIAAGRRRSPATMSGYHRGRPPRNKGLSYPADPPAVEEIISVMRAAGDSPDGVRLRGVIVVVYFPRTNSDRASEMGVPALATSMFTVPPICGKSSMRM